MDHGEDLTKQRAPADAWCRLCHNSLCRVHVNCSGLHPAQHQPALLACGRALLLLLGMLLLLYIESGGIAGSSSSFALKGVDAPAAARAARPSPAPLDPVAAHVLAPRLFLVWTKDMSFWNWVFMAVVESIFFYHPLAHDADRRQRKFRRG